MNKLQNSIFTIFIIAICSSTLLSQTPPPKIDITKYTLSNGLTVYLHEDHTQPKIFGVVICNVGGKDDPSDATGMAHYMEHMLFKGTEELGTTDWVHEKPHIDSIFALYDELGNTTDDEERKNIQKRINEQSVKANEYAIPNEMDNLLKNIGGTRVNAGTGRDNTVFYNTFPSSQIEKWLEIYSHRFKNPVFRSFQAELEVVYEEKNMYEDSFIEKLFETFLSKLYKYHPYGQQTLIGTTDDLKNPSLTKMYDFFKTYYVANNMALVLSGDFNTQELVPLIETKFGAWRSEEVPERKVYEDNVFNGREYSEGRYSPIKLALLGFKTVPAGHEDECILDVCNYILSNDNNSGLIDQLILDNKLLEAGVFSLGLNDIGCMIIIVIPKVIGQKLEDAEELVIEEFKRLREGDFEDWMLEAAKNQLYLEHQKNLESLEEKALMMATSYCSGESLEDVFNYDDKVKKISKEDVIRIASKYYGENYLAFYSKMGSPKKDKIKKPGYEPVLSNTDAKSKFTQHLDSIQESDIEFSFVDFNKDIQDISITDNVRMLYTRNPINDIFTLKIKYGIGKQQDLVLQYAAYLMNYAGSENKSLAQLKDEFSRIGCTYNIRCDDDYVIIQIEGIEEYLDQAIELINELVYTPTLEEGMEEKIYDDEKAGRKLERSEPDYVADALFYYVIYKENSDFLNRFSMKELKNINPDTLLTHWKNAIQYASTFHYTGQKDPDEVIKSVKTHYNVSQITKVSTSPTDREIEKYAENTIYFVDKKKAIQSKVYLIVHSSDYTPDKDPYINAFNIYFGGDFSGLVMQEIREYRSLAYYADAYFMKPKLNNSSLYFKCYVGTQADKTNEAVDVFYNLLTDMPQKPERMETFKKYMRQAASTKYPHFRYLTYNVERWENRGFTMDPEQQNVPVYEKMEFEDLNQFYEENVKGRPIVIAFVGDKSKIDFEALKKYGQLIVLKEDELFSK